MSARHRHRYQRLSDTALFCECGEIKSVAAPMPAPTPSITIYPVPYTVPYTVPNPWPPYTVWTTNGTGPAPAYPNITVWNDTTARA